MTSRVRAAVKSRDPDATRIPRRRVLAGGAGLVALAALPGGALAQGLRYFQIGTGTTGGTYFLIGGMLANAISNPPGSRPCDRGGSCGVPGLIAVAQSTSGSVENVRAIQERRMESGLAQADIAYAAFRAQGAFEEAEPFGELRAIANLYTETVHLVVRADSGIADVPGLRGKRVALGERGSGTLVTARAILSAYGLSEKRIAPVYLSPGAAGDRLATGELDGFFIVGGFPLPAVADLAARLPIRLLPLAGERVEAMARRLPFFTPNMIPALAYAGGVDTPSLGVGAVWVVGSAVDEELVHGVTRALWHPNVRALLDAGHPRGSSIRIETALTALPVPLHPGAERYYREAGYAAEIAALPPREPGIPVPRVKPPTDPVSQ